MSNMISGILLQCVKTQGMLFSIFAKGQIISAHCGPRQVKQCVKCESVRDERAVRVRGQSGSTIVLSARFWKRWGCLPVLPVEFSSKTEASGSNNAA